MRANCHLTDSASGRETSLVEAVQPLAVFVLANIVALYTLAEEPPRLSTKHSNAGLELSWIATIQKTNGLIARPYFELQRTFDFQCWEPISERRRAATAIPGQVLSATQPLDNSKAFYRLLSIEPIRVAKLGNGGAEVFGYGEAFAQELQRIGQISPDQFATMYPNSANYLPGLSWDPTTAEFWDQFNADIETGNQGKNEGDPGYRTFDFQLDQRELPVFKKNGFVVSERLGSGSFADVFYNVWHNDLPVFISTDAILQAWHRTYDAMLEEVEETYLFNSVEQMLAAMAARVPEAWAQAGSGVLKDSILDADYFLAVARSLLAGTNAPPIASLVGQNSRLAMTLADIKAEQMKEVSDFFGQCRVVDFSQFKVRGHYTHSERLGRYFQCVMWLGRTDFAVAGGPFERCPGDVRMASPRELGGAIVLWHLLNQSGQFTSWLNFDRIIQAFVGWSDSMDFAQLGGLLAGAGIRSLADVPDLATLQKLQSDILRGELGVQNIRSDYFVSPFGPEQIQLPRSFLVFGQKFVPDSWAFSQTVYDSILWIANGETNKIERRVPSALDAAFAILANNQVVPELRARMTNTNAAQSLNHAEKWRDGLLYQHNLAAVRAVMDAQQPVVWDGNIYMGWLAAMRELSIPTTDAKYPEAMRTHPWAMKTLNTQLASWTQLRHDTILYAKQSYTAADTCFYPAGFVEPRVAFWQRLRSTATRAADLIAALPYAGNYPLVTHSWQIDPVSGESHLIATTNSILMSTIQSNQVAHLRHFAGTLATLQTLSEKELSQQCFSADEELFIRNLIQHVGRLKWGSGGVRKYDGWYPGLFYLAAHFASLGNGQPDAFFQENYGVNAADQIVADVHTDVPDLIVGDPGSVLHEGIGRVNLVMIAVENGADRMIFAGPVLSHYEFEVIGAPRRLNDEEWQRIQARDFPPDVPASRIEDLGPPVWTKGYLVPRLPE